MAIAFDEVLRTAATCRSFRTDDVPDDILYRALDFARYAPQGGNRQPTRFVVVRDSSLRAHLGGLYTSTFQTLRASMGRGMRIGDDERQASRLENAALHFAEHLHEVPVHVVVCAHMKDLAVTDLDVGRVPIVGGASVYPAVQNFLLGCRSLGLGAALTTMLCAAESEVKRLLSIPDEFATAALIPVGWPARPFPKKLQRRPIEELVFRDRFGSVARVS